MAFETPVEKEGIEIIEAHYHPLKDWREDPVGYFLIRIHNHRLEVGFCRKDNLIEKKFVGKDATVLYSTIIKTTGITAPHAAYLAKELVKAEMAMEFDIPYVQDAPIDVRCLSKNKTCKPLPRNPQETASIVKEKV